MFKLTRHSSNPVLSPNPDLPWEKEGVFNPGVIKINTEVYMLYRAVGEYESYISRLGLAKSLDGVKFDRVSDNPVFEPREVFDRWATEDPRITKIGDDFYVTYVAVPDRIMKDGAGIERFLPLETSTALLTTKDFLSYENLGIISPPNSDNKDIVLFPRTISGLYYMLHRPNHWSKEWINGTYQKYVNAGLPCPAEELPETPGIWIASSSDLKNWTDHRLLMSSPHSSDAKVGPGMPPIETEAGWLIIYHHVSKEAGTTRLIYSMRAALLEKNNPARVLTVLPYDILTPELPYETEKGRAIVFPTGGFIEEDTLYVYYGASDHHICLATGSVSALLNELERVLTGKAELNTYETK